MNLAYSLFIIKQYKNRKQYKGDKNETIDYNI